MFNELDQNGNGYLSKEEFAKFLEENSFYATGKELDLLSERFDRDRDGRVTYSEFF